MPEIVAVWIEGIGSTCGPVTDIPLNMMPVGQFLLHCGMGENELYGADLNAAVDEAMLKAIDRMTTIPFLPTKDKLSGNNRYYDLQGRPQPKPQGKGIYIRQGRKVVK